MKENRVCQILGIEKPIIQGPMSWLTDARLAAAVSAAGGMGSLGPNAGQDHVTPDPAETAERMRTEIRKIRELTDKPFSVNLIPSSPREKDLFTDPMLDMLIEEKVPAVTYVGAGPIFEDIFVRLKEAGIKIIYRGLNPSPKDAASAEAMGADVIVATGFDEGGTLPGRVIGTFSIVPMIVDAVKSVPVMAAGGIADKRTCAAAFALGAEGVYCGTLFLMSEESRMAANVKERALGANGRDLKLFRTIPYYYRSLGGELADELYAMDKAGATNAEIAKKMGGMSNMRVGMLEGDMDKGYVSFGTGIGLSNEIRPVKAIIDGLFE